MYPRAHQHYPDDLLTICNLGNYSFEFRLYEEATYYYRQLKDLLPSNPVVEFAINCGLEKLPDDRALVGYLEVPAAHQTIQSFPLIPDSYLRVTNNFLRNYVIEGDANKSEAFLETAFDLLEKAIERGSNTPEIHNNLLVLYYEDKIKDQSRLAEHRAVVEGKVAASPQSDAVLRFNVGMSYLKEVRSAHPRSSTIKPSPSSPSSTTPPR